MMAALPDPTSYQAVGYLALALFGLIGGINQAMKLIDRLRGEPPAEELNTRLNGLERMVGEMRTELHAGQERRVVSDDNRRRAIYEKIEAVRRELKEDIKDVEEKIGSIPNELVVLLKNTGALRGNRG